MVVVKSNLMECVGIVISVSRYLNERHEQAKQDMKRLEETVVSISLLAHKPENEIMQQ